MSLPFPERYPERPVSFDIDTEGAVVLLDQGGVRLTVADPGGELAVFQGVAPSLRCRFLGDHILLLGADGLLRTLARDGSPVGELQVRAGATNLGVAKSGSVLVSYGRRGAADHGVVMERLGTAPAIFREDSLLDAAALVVEPGGIWIAGTGASSPASRALRLRPTASGYAVRAVVSLPAPPRAACHGVDGALHVVLEPGESAVRIDGERALPPRPLPDPAVEIVRFGKALWGCGTRGFCDLSFLVPPAG